MLKKNIRIEMWPAGSEQKLTAGAEPFAPGSLREIARELSRRTSETDGQEPVNSALEHLGSLPEALVKDLLNLI